ncbi:uncharacterized protein [Cherax quadricarinatus]|nr:uncharacterized protein LOC128698487 [Cherax quadricarinatus]
MPSRCCCCLSLRRGCLIISFITLVVGLLGTAYGILLLIKAGGWQGWLTVVVEILNVLLAILLACSVDKTVVVLVRAWAACTTLQVVMGVIVGVIFIFYDSVIVGVVALCFTVAQVYFVMVVWSYSAAMKATAEE